ncbi:SH3 domain-containing protein [Terrilactibacillus sp. S3-3]|nr:SH3 domain-containing protein [Terrilactibacillus sp. S3-3]
MTAKSQPKTKPASAAPIFASYSGYVIADSLNVRQSPAGKINGTLKKNAAVKVTGKTSKNNTAWFKIKYGSKSGYVSGKYIKKGSPPTAAPKKKKLSLSRL